MSPKPGDFGLVAINGRTGKLVRIAQWLNGDGFSNYEHAFIVIDSDRLVEAEPGGARVRSLDEYADTNVTYSDWSLTGKQQMLVVNTAISLIDTPYSILDYLSLILVRLHIRPKWVAAYVTNSKHMICSQLVDYCYANAYVQLFDDNRLPGDVTPGDLVQVLHEPRTTHGS